MLSARLVTATTRQLKSRGLQFVSNNPDVLLDFYSGLQSGIDTRNQPIMIMPVRNYGSWAGYRSPFGPGDQITEGTLGVRVIDRRSNRLATLELHCLGAAVNHVRARASPIPDTARWTRHNQQWATWTRN